MKKGVNVDSGNNNRSEGSGEAARSEATLEVAPLATRKSTDIPLSVGETVALRQPRETAERSRSYINHVTRMHRAGEWDEEDDAVLLNAVNTFPVYKNYINWSRISREANFAPPGRTAKACRERFFNALDPNLNKGPWSQEEDDFIVEMQRLHGNKWAAIARMLDTNRTDHTVKNRFNVLKRIRNIPDLPKPKRIKKSELQAMRLAELMARRAAAAQAVEARHGMSISELGLGGIGIGATEAPSEMLSGSAAALGPSDMDSAAPVASGAHEGKSGKKVAKQKRKGGNVPKESKAEYKKDSKRPRTNPGADTANALLSLAGEDGDGDGYGGLERGTYRRKTVLE